MYYSVKNVDLINNVTSRKDGHIASDRHIIDTNDAGTKESSNSHCQGSSNLGFEAGAVYVLWRTGTTPPTDIIPEAFSNNERIKTMKINLHQRLRSVLKDALAEYQIADDHLSMHDELPRYFFAARECEAGLQMLNEDLDGGRLTNDQIAADYANLIRTYLTFVAQSGSALRVRMLDQLISDIEGAATAQEVGHAAS